MKSTGNLLDTRLGDVVRKRPGGDIGIELELEGKFPSIPDLVYWSVKGEGSLRGGVEFVLTRPVKLQNLSGCLEELSRVLKVSTPKKTIRCSTHFHINVLPLTHREIYNVLGYYFLLEDLLVQTQGVLRQGNLFCLRMSDAEAVALHLVDSIRNQNYFQEFNMNWHKYGAVNLAAPLRFGSLEFRFFRPMDPDQIDFWARLLYKMVYSSASLPMSRYLDMVERGDFVSFLSPFSKEEREAILQDLPPHAVKDALSENYESIRRIQKYLDRKTKFKIPDSLLESDIDLGSAPEGASPSPTPWQPAHILDDYTVALADLDWVEPEDDFDPSLD